MFVSCRLHNLITNIIDEINPELALANHVFAIGTIAINVINTDRLPAASSFLSSAAELIRESVGLYLIFVTLGRSLNYGFAEQQKRARTPS